MPSRPARPASSSNPDGLLDAPPRVRLGLQDDGDRRGERGPHRPDAVEVERPADDELDLAGLLRESRVDGVVRGLGRDRVPVRERRGREGPVRFDLDPEALVVKADDERADVLGQGLASRQADPCRRVVATEPADLVHDLLDGHLAAVPPGPLGVAEAAAEVAAGQADEDRRLALAQALALDRGEDLNRLQSRWPRHRRTPRPSPT